MEAATADPRPAYLLEQLPEMREALCRGVVWAKVAKGARETVLNDSQAHPDPPSLPGVYVQRYR